MLCNQFVLFFVGLTFFIKAIKKLNEDWFQVVMKYINDDSTVGVDVVHRVMFFTFCAADFQWCLTLGAS